MSMAGANQSFSGLAAGLLSKNEVPTGWASSTLSSTQSLGDFEDFEPSSSRTKYIASDFHTKTGCLYGRTCLCLCVCVCVLACISISLVHCSNSFPQLQEAILYFTVIITNEWHHVTFKTLSLLWYSQGHPTGSQTVLWLSWLSVYSWSSPK